MKLNNHLIKLFLVALLMSSCQQDAILEIDESSIQIESKSNKKKKNQATELELSPEMLQFTTVEEMFSNINSKLALSGASYRIEKLEYLTNNGAENMGQTIYANNRSLRLTSRWVPGDSRRLADGNNITYLNDNTFRAANGSIDSSPPIDASFETWDSGTNCSDMPIVKRVDTGENPNYVLMSLFGVPVNPFLADIVETGFLPGWLFDVIAPGGSGFILGVTFTLIFVDENGNPTDIDNNGSTDTALKEVWYNDAFLWSTSGGGIDIETVALHENGHALELGHFGKISVTNANGEVHFSPRAVMNAAYSGVQRDINEVTNAAHCSQFGSWPQN